MCPFNGLIDLLFLYNDLSVRTKCVFVGTYIVNLQNTLTIQKNMNIVQSVAVLDEGRGVECTNFTHVLHQIYFSWSVQIGLWFSKKYTSEIYTVILFNIKTII